MGQMTIYPEWAFKLLNAEMMITLKALGGRLANPEEAETARVLGDKLTKWRIVELELVTKKLREALNEDG